MKRLLTLALLGILGVAAFGHSQEIPNGVKEYMYQLQHDPTVEYGFDEAKKWRFIDQNVQFQDWYVGLPFQFFDLNVEKLEAATMDTKFEDLVEPSNRWCIPIRINNDGYIYHVLAKVDGEGFKPGGCGEGVLNRTWDEVRKKFPEESGIIPMYNYAFHLLYFPNKKDGKNLFHLSPPSRADSISKVTSKSLDNLDDGKTIIPLLEDIYKMHEGYRKRLERLRKENGKNPDNFNDTSGGKK